MSSLGSAGLSPSEPRERILVQLGEEVGVQFPALSSRLRRIVATIDPTTEIRIMPMQPQPPPRGLI